MAFNISKGTTKKELIDIVGVSEHQRRMQGINLSGGPTNAAEFCQFLLGAPKFEQFLETYMEETGKVEPKLIAKEISNAEMSEELKGILGFRY